MPGGGPALLGAALLLDAVVTAVLNLDTAVVFLTPVLVFAARRRRVAVEPFLYGCVFMANASSLFLPGSNLTNLLVLDAHGGGSGAAFAAKMFPVAITAALVTAVGIAISFRRALAKPPGTASSVDPPPGVRTFPSIGRESANAPGSAEAPAVVLGAGVIATVLAVVFALALSQPALAVLAVGLVATAIELARERIDLAAVWRILGLPSLAAAFVLTVALGTLGPPMGRPGRTDRRGERAGDRGPRRGLDRPRQQPARGGALLGATGPI